MHHHPVEGRNEKDLPQEASQRELYERFIHEDYCSGNDEVKDHWEEERDEDSPSDEMTKIMNYERFVHHNYLSHVDTEEDHINVPSIEKLQQNGGYKRRVVTKLG